MYQFNVWIHILMAIVWVGGLVYTSAVVVPYAVKQEPGERQRILRAFGRRFRWIGWGAVILAVVTGMGNLALRPTPVRIEEIFNGRVRNIDPSFADWIGWKLGLVGAMILLMLFHDVTSVRAAKKHSGPSDSAPGNKLGTIAASVAMLVSIAIIYVSVRLVRG